MSAPIVIKTTPLSYRIPVTDLGTLAGTTLSITDYVQRFVEWDYNNYTRTWLVARKYRYYNAKTAELYLPAYDLPRFLAHLDSARIAWRQVALPLTTGQPVDIPIRPGMAPRDAQQVESVDYLVSETAPVRGLACRLARVSRVCCCLASVSLAAVR
jgi:hypothetical protein